MGTCFTKTEYVSGRQLNTNFGFKRRSSFAFLPSLDDSFLCSKSENVKKLDDPLKRTSRSIHGTNGIQCRYNRWISRRQESCSKDVPEYQEEYSTVDPELASSLKCPNASLSLPKCGMIRQERLVSDVSGYGENKTQEIKLLHEHMKTAENLPSHKSLSQEYSVSNFPDIKKKHHSFESRHHNKYYSDGYKLVTRNMLLSDKHTCLPPLFTNHQKKLAIEAWKKVNCHVEKVGMNEFAKLFHYNSAILRTFPILAHHMSDIELTSENYFVGPKTEDRICSHTTAIFEMLDGVIKELEYNETDAGEIISDTLFKEGTRHFGYGCYLSSIELFGMMMVRSLVNIIKQEDLDPVKLKQMEEAIFIFMKVVTFWLMEGMKYIKGHNR